MPRGPQRFWLASPRLRRRSRLARCPISPGCCWALGASSLPASAAPSLAAPNPVCAGRCASRRRRQSSEAGEPAAWSRGGKAGCGAGRCGECSASPSQWPFAPPAPSSPAAPIAAPQAVTGAAEPPIPVPPAPSRPGRARFAGGDSGQPSRNRGADAGAGWRKTPLLRRQQWNQPLRRARRPCGAA